MLRLGGAEAESPLGQQYKEHIFMLITANSRGYLLNNTTVNVQIDPDPVFKGCKDKSVKCYLPAFLLHAK